MAKPTPETGYFPERAQRLKNICTSLKLRQDYPLLKSGPLDADGYARLCDAVTAYMLGTLSRYHDRYFASVDDWLTTYQEEILALPNITPNGLILPKLETSALYGQVHLAVAEIIENCRLEQHAKSFHVPINLRLVNGVSAPGIDKRPRASAKYHSDMWAGEPATAIMVFLPVFGDTDNLGIHWVEPAEFPANLMGPLDDFDQGGYLVKEGSDYAADFMNGEIVLSDPFLIHATQKKAPGLRLSIDFRLIADQRLISDQGAPGTRLDSYMPFDDWRKIGRTKGLFTTAKLEPFKGSDEPTKNEYAHPFSVYDYDQGLSTTQLAELVAMPADFVHNTIPETILGDLRYRSATSAEFDAIAKRAAELNEATLPATNDDDRQARWNDGWGEILARVEDEGVSAETLMPGYFRHDTLRLGGRYIKVPDPAFEYRLHRVIARLLFAEYLAGYKNVVELGCGTGANLHLLHQLYPDKRLIGADWAEPSQALVSLVDGNDRVVGINLNLLTMDGTDRLPTGSDVAIFTMHALEQLGANHSLLVEYLLNACPGIVLHVEPVAELYDSASKFDQSALNYHNKRNYLDGYLSKLKELAAAGKIELIKAHRTGFGSPFQEAYSILVWRPL